MDYKWINIKQGLALYGLDQWEKVYDPDTDTHCVIGWSVPRQAAVVAFRCGRLGRGLAGALCRLCVWEGKGAAQALPPLA